MGDASSFEGFGVFFFSLFLLLGSYGGVVAWMFHVDSTRHSEDIDFRKRPDNRYHDSLYQMVGGGRSGRSCRFIRVTTLSFPHATCSSMESRGIGQGGHIMAMMRWFFNRYIISRSKTN